MKNTDKTEDSLPVKVITQEEFDDMERETLFGNIVSFILSIVAIGCILFGSCIVNIYIVQSTNMLEGGVSLYILIGIWLLFPVILFGWIANITKNKGVKWATILLGIITFLIAAYFILMMLA